MTLALYGKSRQRQRGLIFAGFMAVIFAALMGVVGLQSALAHHTAIRVETECGTPAVATIHFDFVGPDERTYTIETRPNGAAAWTEVAQFQIEGANEQDVYPFIEVNLPSTAQYRALINNGEDSQVDLSNLGAGPCTPATIIVKKVFQGGDTNTPFTATIDNKSNGNEGSGSGLQFNPTKLTQIVNFDSGDTADAFDVTEAAVAGFLVTGWTVSVGGAEADCPASTAPWSGSNGDYSTDQFNLAVGQVATVCFRNAPVTVPKLKVIKEVVDHNGVVSFEDPENFTFSVTNQTNFELDDDSGSATPKEKSFTLPAVSPPTDTYTIDETDAGSGGFTLVSIQCDGAVSLGNTDVGDGNIEVTVNNSSDVTCTFTNQKAAPEELTFSKVATAGVTSTSNPADIKWDITFYNNTDQHRNIGITDAGVVVVGAPVFTDNNGAGIFGDPNCTGVSDGASLATEKTCFLPPDTGVKITVAPSPAPVQTCQPQIFGNQMSWRQHTYNFLTPNAWSGSTTTPASPVNITLNALPAGQPPCVTSSQTITKTEISSGPYTFGDDITWDITVNVAGAATTADLQVSDDLPAGFSVVSATNMTASPFVLCGDAVVCYTLSAGAAVGNHTIRVVANVENSAACTEHTNVAVLRNGESEVDRDDDAVTVGGCGVVTFDKTAIGVVGNEVHWKITFTNTSVLEQSLTVWDQGVSVESHTCNSLTVIGDNYTCAVPGTGAGGTAEIVVSKPVPDQYSPVCDNLDMSNTASVAGSQTSDTAQVTDTADGGTDCLKVTKELSDTSEPPTWTVSIASTSDNAVTVFVRDAGATFQGVVSGGSCGVAAPAAMDAGFTCNINANSILIFTVTKLTPGPTCEGTPVSNTIEVWLATFAYGTPDFTADGGTHEDVNANPDLCTQVIQLCKVWLPNAINNGSTGFLFDVSDEDGGVSVAINNVAEGDANGNCILLSVAPGEVNISEQIPTGFVLDGWTLGDGATQNLDLGDLIDTNLATLFVGSRGCDANSETETLLANILGLARSIAALVAVVDSGDPVCTVTFFNHDDGVTLNSGSLRIEKYLDINGDGDANDVALGEGLINGWAMTTVGPDINETVATGSGPHPAGAILYDGLITGDMYTVTEETQAGYTVTNATVNGAPTGATTNAITFIPNGGTTVIAFYNQPKGSINVHKEAQTVHNGNTAAAPNDDDGWTITLTSANCGINQVAQTDANGNASFTGLPLCDDYIVTEAGTNASSPGFVQVSPVGPFTNQSPEGQTLTFLNRRVTNDPPCQNCTQTTPTPTTTPTTTPTATPTTPATATPTNTPVTQIAGERTPGATIVSGQTPIAPSAGSGILGGTSGGFNILLVLAGLAALTGGLGFLALGRKSR